MPSGVLCLCNSIKGKCPVRTHCEKLFIHILDGQDLVFINLCKQMDTSNTGRTES